MSRRLILSLVAASLATTGTALASNVTEFPDNGSEQMARGGAWVARASDPLAAFYNPAGLAGQDTRLTLQGNIAIQNTCFSRIKASNDTTVDGVDPGKAYPKVCNDGAPGFGPQLAMSIKVSDRIGVGVAVLGPSGVAGNKWPEFNPDGTPAPQRYLLTSGNALVLTPTLAIGARVLDTLRVGASFQWGIATVQFAAASDSLNGNNSTPSANDVKALLLAKDYFIPGFTLGTIWSPHTMLDVAGWYKWSAPIDASGDVATYANYYRPAVAKNGMDNQVAFGYTKDPGCDTTPPAASGICGPDKGSVKVPIPMEAKLGFRFHKPVANADPKRRDPMSQDVWDVEADFTWANNSAFDVLQVRFPGNADGSGIIPVNGTGGNLPPNADVPHHFKDVVGLRVGGDWNVLPDQLAIRAGAFGETKGQDDAYQNIDFMGGARVGLSLGGTYRIKFGKAEKKSALEISAGFMHMFVTDQSGGGGVRALAGVGCNASTQPPGETCADGGPKYRTVWAANLGTITNALNVINVGLSYRF